MVSTIIEALVDLFVSCWFVSDDRKIGSVVLSWILLLLMVAVVVGVVVLICAFV